MAVGERAGGAGDWLGLAACQVGFGVLAGVAAGCFGAMALKTRMVIKAVNGLYAQLATISIAVAAFALAGVLDGNGFIAAFTAGVAFGRVAPELGPDVQDFTEDEGALLSAVTFLVFGAVLAGPVLDELTVRTAVYALLSLTVIRVVPVLIAMVGTGTLWETRWFIGWFGPRGLASILFALLVLEGMEDRAGASIFAVAAWTVLASIFLHGATAEIWGRRIAGRFASMPSTLTETGPATELPTRPRFD
ncbi:hypothetical protein BH24ACT5_BH24ACT5_01150 [soil metagenome]